MHLQSSYSVSYQVLYLMFWIKFAMFLWWINYICLQRFCVGGAEIYHGNRWKRHKWTWVILWLEKSNATDQTLWPRSQATWKGRQKNTEGPKLFSLYFFEGGGYPWRKHKWTQVTHWPPSSTWEEGGGVQYKYRKHKGSTQLEALPKSRKQTATNFDGPI